MRQLLRDAQCTAVVAAPGSFRLTYFDEVQTAEWHADLSRAEGCQGTVELGLLRGAGELASSE